MNKISIAISIAALLVIGCSDKPKEQETTAATTKQQTTAAETASEAPSQDLYGVSSQTSAQHTEAATKDVQAGTNHVATVLETMNAANYTYAKVDEDGNVYWIAGPEAAIAVGDQISFIDQMVMEDFTSKALGKTFEYLVFASTLIPTNKTANTPAVKQEHDCDSCGPSAKTPTPTPTAAAAAAAPASHNGSNQQPTQVDDVNVAKIAGGYTVEELYTKKVELKDKKIKVQAKVVKVSKNIMNKDWVHLQDGTGNGGTSDIVVTAQNTTVNVGDVVITEALLQTDVDFGYGYFFPVILQEANFTPAK